MTLSAPDLTKRPPRSPRVRLGGYVILPRMLDKCRATLAGQAGEFRFNCPLDQRFFAFVGLAAAKLKKEAAKNKSDGELLDWIQAQAKSKHSPMEIAAWSAAMEQGVPSDVETRSYFHELHAKLAPKRKDVGAWFDLLDIDDFVTFGGKA